MTPCWVYRSELKEELYIYLVKHDDFDSLPDALKQLAGPLTEVMSLTLTPERKLARQDVSTVIANLKSQGYHVQMPPTREELLRNEKELISNLH